VLGARLLLSKEVLAFVRDHAQTGASTGASMGALRDTAALRDH